jgi:phosphoglycerate kinase
MEKKTVRDIDVTGKRVLVRVDYNVPLDIENGAITDDSKIKSTLPTIQYLIDNKARIILCSHLGRPKGKVVEALRLRPVAKRLSQLIQKPVISVDDCIGSAIKKAAEELKDSDVLMLENLRFHPEEEGNDPNFAKALSELAEVYVNDAFGTAHRAHASTAGITKYLPAVAGFLIEKELDVLSELLSKPAHPFAALLGGAKASDKLGLIENILNKVNLLLIGGGMAANFLKVKGYEVGRSKVEEETLGAASKLIELMTRNSVPLFLPVDVVVVKEINSGANGKIVTVNSIPADMYIVDIGPKTIVLFSHELKNCRTIFWNGPMGIYEFPQFANGTKSLVTLLASLGATTVVGGGSTAEIVEEMDMTDKMTHVSTGGGASLEFLEGRELPGIAALQDK